MLTQIGESPITRSTRVGTSALESESTNESAPFLLSSNQNAEHTHQRQKPSGFSRPLLQTAHTGTELLRTAQNIWKVKEEAQIIMSLRVDEMDLNHSQDR
ncbi:unnamed protein product [Knipowitschia caucasica]